MPRTNRSLPEPVTSTLEEMMTTTRHLLQRSGSAKKRRKAAPHGWLIKPHKRMWLLLIATSFLPTCRSAVNDHRDENQWVVDNRFDDFIDVGEITPEPSEPEPQIVTLYGKIRDERDCNKYTLKWESEAKLGEDDVDEETCEAFLHLEIQNKPSLLDFEYVFVATSKDGSKAYMVSVKAKSTLAPSSPVPTIEAISQEQTTGSQTTISADSASISSSTPNPGIVDASAATIDATVTYSTKKSIAPTDSSETTTKTAAPPAINTLIFAILTSVLLLLLLPLLFLLVYRVRQRSPKKNDVETLIEFAIAHGNSKESQQRHLAVMDKIEDLSQPSKKEPKELKGTSV